MEQNKDALDGYMTVEAALLFPIIFTIIILMIFLGFFLYDRCLLEDSAYIAALRGSQMQNVDNEEIYVQTSQLAKELVDTKIFSGSNLCTNVSVDFNKVKVSYELSVKPPIGSLLVQITNKNYFQIKVSKEAKRMHTIGFIRGIRKAEKYVEKKESVKDS